MGKSNKLLFGHWENVKEMKADAYAKNATVGVEIIKKWLLNHENN